MIVLPKLLQKLAVPLAFAALMMGVFLLPGTTAAAPKVAIDIGSKDFTESILISEIFAQALENAGFKVNRKQALGGTPIIQAAMQAGQIGLYPEYTSTALVMVLKETAEPDPAKAYEKVKSAYLDRFDFVLLDMASLNNSQGMAITKKAADRYGIKTLTDLSKTAGELRLCSTPEFEDRKDGLAGLRERLGGFDFKSIKIFDKGIKYEVLRRDEADVNICFTTDAHLSQGDIVAIEDDIQFWPPYNLVPIVRKDVLDGAPEIADILNPICAKLNNATMQKLNATVDLDQKEYREVAAAFLKEKGFIR